MRLYERDSKEYRRDPLPFRGDQISDTEGAHPPLGWTIVWGEHIAISMNAAWNMSTAGVMQYGMHSVLKA